jgi:HIRAN domain
VGPAFPSHGRGHRFETCHAHQNKQPPSPQRDLRCQQIASKSLSVAPSLRRAERGCHGPAIDIAGESYYQDALEQVGGGRGAFGVQNQLITVELVREPTNSHDPNAVKIQADGHQLGYLPREEAPRFHAVIDKLTAKDRPATCRARLTGGWDRGRDDRGSIGLRILTGRRPAIWNGRVAFLPDRPFHEHHQVQLLAGLADEQ